MAEDVTPHGSNIGEFSDKEKVEQRRELGKEVSCGDIWE